MKCVILAGGSGDNLWPLSRKNYPKQFMNIKEGRSLLQETVVRNMPYCDEFIIVTNAAYKNIVNGQLKAFQSIKYRIILEGASKGTAAAIMLGEMYFNPSELIFVVTSDAIVDGNDYKDAIMRGKDLAKKGFIVSFGVKPKSENAVFGYIRRKEDDFAEFSANIEKIDNLEIDYKMGFLWNTGCFMFRVGDMNNAIKQACPELYTTCRTAKRKVKVVRRFVRFPENIMQDMPQGSIERLVLSKTDDVKVVEADINWIDIGTVGDIQESESLSHTGLVVKNDCSGVTVINNADRQLVVTNDLSDVVVVNTEDAIYVSSKKSAGNIKSIIARNTERYSDYFDYNRFSYRKWGMHELLTFSNDYKVKKVTIYPGLAMDMHSHEQRVEQWSVVEGIATITIGDETRDYGKYETVSCPIGVKHKIANKTDSNVIIIETSIGEKLNENDMVRIYAQDLNSDIVNYIKGDSISPIVKLDPAFKDNLWGGTKLRTVFGKKCDYDVIGESWELSAHPDGQSRIASGRYKGMFFNEYLSVIGKDALGWKCQAQDRFPILIKFIDAKDALSIQIHPDDDYGLENEDEYGKNEMWYVVDAEPGAYLYCGLAKDVDRSEIRRRIKNNTITDILNKIEVKPGDVVMVKAGTIHAIGAGILICEIQQNSNCTYRMYDYDRRDKFGNLRELHIDKAMDVVDNKAYAKDPTTNQRLEKNEHFKQTRLVQCKYFEVQKFEIEDEAKIPVDESSFVSVVVISGEGNIQTDDYNKSIKFKAGDSFFIAAGKRNINVTGKATIVVTHV